jgi:hypothetical protein
LLQELFALFIQTNHRFGRIVSFGIEAQQIIQTRGYSHIRIRNATIPRSTLAIRHFIAVPFLIE